MSDPFLITGPSLISFSGGRTSAYMLWRILQAHGGTLPDGVVVAFANTGREREETLRFVHECGSRWGVRIHWLELRGDGTHYGTTEEVGFNGASRAGEPFSALIDHKRRLPNGRERWCTEFLKVRPTQALMGRLGYGAPGDYTEVIGLRYDEIDRVADGRRRAEKDGRNVDYPLVGARISKRDVRGFWWGADRRFETSLLPQGFDLDLPDLWGNCDLCFAMGVAVREERVRQRPEVATWWDAAEESQGGTFSKRESVGDLIRRAQEYAATPDLIDEIDEHDAECGLWCAGVAA